MHITLCGWFIRSCPLLSPPNMTQHCVVFQVSSCQYHQVPCAGMLGVCRLLARFASRFAPTRPVDERQVGILGHGWQHEATQAVQERALVRSQGGPLSGPVSQEVGIESSSFQVLVLRRLWLPLPPSSCNCRCGLPLDLRGHHREVAGWGVGSLGFCPRVSCGTL